MKIAAANQAIKLAVGLHEEDADDNELNVVDDADIGRGDEKQDAKETFKVSKDATQQLENENIDPDSVVVTRLDTQVELSPAVDQKSFGPDSYYLDAVSGMIYFDQSLVGKRVSVEYQFGDEPTLDEEATSEDEDDTKEKYVGPKGKSDGSWARGLGPEWFKFHPEIAKAKINESLEFKLTKNVDVLRGLRVIDAKTGKVLKSKLTSVKVSKNKGLEPTRPPGPGEVSFAPTEGVFFFGPGAEGRSFNIEYFLKNEQGKKKYPDELEEKKLVDGIQHAETDLWVALFKHPDVDYILDTLIPSIEDELEHDRATADENKRGDIPDLTEEFMKLEPALHKLKEDPKARSSASHTEHLSIPEDQIIEMPGAKHIAPDSLLVKSNEGKAFKRTDEDPKAGQFVFDPSEGLLLFNEADAGQQVTVSFSTDGEPLASQISRYVAQHIAPKLRKYHSLATLLAEQGYETGSEHEDTKLDEFSGSGARVHSLPFVKYMQNIRSTANKVEGEIADFSRFYTDEMLKHINNPNTYGIKDKKQVRRVFEEAGLDLTDVLAVALDAFRRGLLEYDRSKVKDESGEDISAEKVRVSANPKIWRGVDNALNRLFHSVRKEVMQESTRSRSKRVLVPAGGGEVDLETKGINPEQIQVIGPDGRKFKPPAADGYAIKAEAGRGGGAVLALKKLKARKFFPSTSIEVFDASGKAYTRVYKQPGQSDAEFNHAIRKGDGVFAFAHGGGNVWLPTTALGKTFKVLIDGKGPKATGELQHDEYRLNPGEGKIEFSAANEGDEVTINFTQVVKTLRRVDDSAGGDDDEDEGAKFTLTETQADEGQDLFQQMEEVEGHERASRVLDAIADILTMDEDPRLDEKDRALLMGLLGIGQENGQALTLREIASRPPFNVNLADPQASQKIVSRVVARKTPAVSALFDILEDKFANDPSMLKAFAPFRAKMLGKGGRLDKDQFRNFIEKLTKENKPEDIRSFRGVLDKIVKAARLTEDEENILRWMWSLHGPLRRDDKEEDDTRIDFLEGAAGSAMTPLDVVAKDEFGIEPDDEAGMANVRRVYARALRKFKDAFDKVMASDKNKDAIAKRTWGKDFSDYYKGQRGIEQGIQLQEQEESDAGSKRQKLKYDIKKQEPKSVTNLPIYDQIKNATPAEKHEDIKKVLEQLAAAQSKGKNLASLIDAKQAEVDALLKKLHKSVQEKHQPMLNKVKDLRAELSAKEPILAKDKEALQDAIADIRSVLSKGEESADEEQKAELHELRLRIKIIDEALAAIDVGPPGVADFLNTKDLDKQLKEELASENDPAVREKLIAHTDKLRALYKQFDFLKDMNEEQLEQAKAKVTSERDGERAKLRKLRRLLLTKNPELRDEHKQLRAKKLKLTSDVSKLEELVTKQRAELDRLTTSKGQVSPERKSYNSDLKDIEKQIEESPAQKQLSALESVSSFLMSHPELKRGNQYNLTNLFDVHTPPADDTQLAPDEKAIALPADDDKAIAILTKLSDDDDKHVRVNVARHPRTTADILAKLADDHEPVVRQTVAQNPNTSADVLEKLAKDKESIVRRYVASNKNTPAKAIAALLKDKSEDVKHNALENPNAPKSEPKPQGSFLKDTEIKKKAKEINVNSPLFVDIANNVGVESEPAAEAVLQRVLAGMIRALSSGATLAEEAEKFSPNEKALLRKVILYLRDNRPDLRKEDGEWDLEGLYSPELAPGQDKFKPLTKEEPKVTERSLYEDLLTYALPIDPEENKKVIEANRKKFRLLLTKLREHFASGKTLTSFIKNPNMGASTLPNQAAVLAKVKEYLTKYEPELQTRPDVWNLKTMERPRSVEHGEKPGRSVVKPEAKQVEEFSAEQLANTQKLSSDQASALNAMINPEKGLLARHQGNFKEMLRHISTKLSDSSLVAIAIRLRDFLDQHPDIAHMDKETGEVSYNFAPLYSGEMKLPAEQTKEERVRTRPVKQAITPLVRAILRESKDEEKGLNEVQVRTRIDDMLDQMSSLAEEGLDLHDMEVHFEAMDRSGHSGRDYSLAYLFQKVRVFLENLNKAVGLKNSKDSLGLAHLFDSEAGAGTKTPIEELAQEGGLDADQSKKLKSLVEYMQAQMAKGITLTDIKEQPAVKRNAKLFALVVGWLGKNKGATKTTEPGIWDLSGLTGEAFKRAPQAPATEAPKATMPEAKSEAPTAPAQAPAVSVDDAPIGRELFTTIFRSLEKSDRELLVAAIKDKGKTIDELTRKDMLSIQFGPVKQWRRSAAEFNLMLREHLEGNAAPAPVEEKAVEKPQPAAKTEPKAPKAKEIPEMPEPKAMPDVPELSPEERAQVGATIWPTIVSTLKLNKKQAKNAAILLAACKKQGFDRVWDQLNDDNRALLHRVMMVIEDSGLVENGGLVDFAAIVLPGTATEPSAKKKTKQAPPAAPAATPAPEAPPAAAAPALTPDKLMLFAVKKIHETGIDLPTFAYALSKKHPELMPVWDKIKDKVQRMVDELNQEGPMDLELTS